MSPYAQELAHARLEAIRQLVTAMQATDDPAETRRCALAIFSAPDPCDLDDEIELEDEDEDDDTQDQRTPSVSERAEAPSLPTSPNAPITPSSAATVPSPLTHEMGERSMDSIDDSEEDPFPNIPTEQLLAQATAALQQLRAIAHPG